MLSTGTIFLPKEYKPEGILENLERLHGFFSKTFCVEQGKKFSEAENSLENSKIDSDELSVPNAFTNRIFAEKFEGRLRKSLVTTKSYTFPMDNQNLLPYRSKTAENTKKGNQITCNYAEIVASRRVRELQVLGCLLVEIFMSRQLRCLKTCAPHKTTFTQRLNSCRTAAKTYKNEIPPCIKNLLTLLLDLDNENPNDFKYPAVTDWGLPPPSAHLLLEPMLHSMITFPKHFPYFYALISSLKHFASVSEELKILYYFECNGQSCNEFESVERTRMLLAQNIAECKVKLCARNLENLLDELNTTTDIEIVNILLPHIKSLIEEPSTSILSAWYLFDPFSRALGPQKTQKNLLQSILKLYENELNEYVAFFNNKIVKLYHHSFLLCLMVRLGLKCFLEHFITPLVEAVGGYRDYEQVEFTFHNHKEKIVRKPSNLKSMANEQTIIAQGDDSGTDSEKIGSTPSPNKKEAVKNHEEMFDFDPEEIPNESVKNLLAHLELNVDNDLPFDHSTAEEALDATLSENIDHMRNLEELNININDEGESNYPISPTIPIPSTYKSFELSNISCDVGSKKSENEMFVEDLLDSPSVSNHGKSLENISIASTSKSTQKSGKSDAKISDMSADSLIWLAHRLGPVLTARYLSRNLLKMLTLCYVGKDALVSVPDEEFEGGAKLSIANGDVVGDQNAAKVLECLSSIAGEYVSTYLLLQHLACVIF